MKWKPKIGYEGLYEISNLGDVKSLARFDSPRETILTPCPNKGYPQVCLSKNGKPKTYFIHQLILEYYHGPCPEGLVSRHLDGSKDNEPENLKYGTHSENELDKVKHGTDSSTYLSKPVRCIETGIIYKSATEAERQTGISQGNISQVCNGKRKTAGGYHWEFV